MAQCGAVEKKDQKPSTIRQWLAGALGTSNGVIFGLYTGFLSVGLDSLYQEGRNGSGTFRISDLEMNLLGSTLTLATSLACPFSGFLAARVGRKWPIIVTLLPIAISWGIIAGSKNLSMLMAGHILGGIADGLRGSVTLLYMSEASHPRLRGRLMNAVSTCVVGATLAEYLAALFLSWRGLAIFNLVASLALLPIQFRLPESPIWLVMQGREEEAKNSLQWLYGPNYNCESDFNFLVKEYSSVARSGVVACADADPEHQTILKKQKMHFRDVFQVKYLKPVMIVLVVIVARQYCGGMVIIMYASQVLRSSTSGLDPKYAVIVLGGVQLVMLYAAGNLYDKVGRRKAVVISGCTMAAGHGAMGTYLLLQGMPRYAHHFHDGRLSWLAVVFLAISLIGFSLGIASIFNVIQMEIVPREIKDQAAGLFVGMNNACLALSVMSLHYFMEWIKPYGTFWLYACVSILTMFIFLRTVKETKGLHLADTKNEPRCCCWESVRLFDHDIRFWLTYESLK